ncbi:hypothetical protein P2318_23010 [Myxococcaceae bacterium GXIMD 01537]
MAAFRLLRSFSLVALAGLTLSCGRAYPLDPGCYEMTATEVLRDDCSLLASPEALWNGSMQLSGQVIRMDYELLNMQLIGSFLWNTDAFALDGTVANVFAPANGQQCLLDQVNVHMEAEPPNNGSFTRFDGVVRVRYEARRPDSCVCELWARFKAQHVQDPSTCSVAP